MKNSILPLVALTALAYDARAEPQLELTPYIVGRVLEGCSNSRQTNLKMNTTPLGLEFKTVDGRDRLFVSSEDGKKVYDWYVNGKKVTSKSVNPRKGLEEVYAGSRVMVIDDSGIVARTTTFNLFEKDSCGNFRYVSSVDERGRHFDLVSRFVGPNLRTTLIYNPVNHNLKIEIISITPLNE